MDSVSWKNLGVHFNYFFKKYTTLWMVYWRQISVPRSIQFQFWQLSQQKEVRRDTKFNYYSLNWIPCGHCRKRLLCCCFYSHAYFGLEESAFDISQQMFFEWGWRPPIIHCLWAVWNVPPLFCVCKELKNMGNLSMPLPYAQKTNRKCWLYSRWRSVYFALKKEARVACNNNTTK